jgi:hypothetical protein
MRTPDVVNATAAGSRNSFNTMAAPIAMAAAAIQETIKTRIFVVLSERVKKGNRMIMDWPDLRSSGQMSPGALLKEMLMGEK